MRVHSRAARWQRFGLTGTPMSNKYEELWVLFDFVSNSRVGSLKDFKHHYAKALKEGQARSARAWQIRKRIERQEELWRLISNWMLQATHTAPLPCRPRWHGLPSPQRGALLPSLQRGVLLPSPRPR